MKIAFVLLAACGGSQVAQSHPQATDRGPAVTLPAVHDALDACRQHNLELLNGYRAKAGVAPLVLDDTMTAFAQEGSVWEARDRAPHTHSKAKSRETFRGTYRHENQGPIDGTQIDPTKLVESCRDRVTQLMDRFMENGPGEGHHDAILDARHHRLGVGLHVEGSLMWITNDFIE